MGTCGLGTEKAGLPIEKQLTVKNEGSVAVTLSLSTSAPYSIVSVLPTLAPGQSGQVTVRFDPNESGSFTGNVQVGIQNGQGSLTSGPLNGVAHSLRMTSLEYGRVLVGESRTQVVILENVGTTTVALQSPPEPDVTSMSLPFIAHSNSVTLEPGQNVEVRVEFAPSASGTFAGSAVLGFIGNSNVEIPVRGLSYTEEEIWAWYELQREADAEACQASADADGVGPVMHVPTGELDAILYGFRCLTEEQFRDVVGFVLSGDWDSYNPTLPGSEPDIIPWPLGFWDAQQFLQALAFLINAPSFDQAFSSIYEGNHTFSPAFQTFVDTLRLVNLNLHIGPFSIPLSYDPLLGNDPGRQAVVYLVDMLRYDSSLFGTLITIMQQLSQTDSSWIIPLPEAAERSRVQITFFYMFARNWAFTGVPEYQAAGLTTILVAQFVKAVAVILPTNQEIALAAFAGLVNKMLAQGRPIFGPAEGFANGVAQVIVLGGLTSTHWTIKWAGILQDNSGMADLHFVATQSINGRPTAAFIHVEARLGPEEITSVAKTLLDIATIAAIATDSSLVPNPFADFDVIGYYGVGILIVYNSDPNTVEQLVQKLGTPNATIVIIWIDGQNIVHATAVCGQGGCPGGKTAQEYANSVAQALGLQPDQPLDLSAVSGIPPDQLAQIRFLMTVSTWRIFRLTLMMCEGDLGCVMFLLQGWTEYQPM